MFPDKFRKIISIKDRRLIVLIAFVLFNAPNLLGSILFDNITKEGLLEFDLLIGYDGSGLISDGQILLSIAVEFDPCSNSLTSKGSLKCTPSDPKAPPELLEE